MSGPVLVTGGTGKVGRRIADRLRAAGVDHRVASRHPDHTDPAAVRFDWADPTTWDGAVAGASAVYLVAPPGGDPAPVMIELVRAAQEHGATRFVLQSASLVDRDGPAMGRVHAHLADEADDWAVLRPSWFMQNVTEGFHGDSIRDGRVIETAAGDGRVPFIDADDIADVATHVLTAAAARNADAVLTGPEALTFDGVAAQITAALGEPVRHRRVTADEVTAGHVGRGIPRAHAEMLGVMDLLIAEGAEDRVTDEVRAITGRPARSFADFVAAHVAAWRALPADAGSP